jgi:hypothetical protein
MKLEQSKQIEFASNMALDGYDASIDASSMSKLFDIFQDPYKNAIGAVIREYVSNSFDSHAEARFIKDNSLEVIRNEYGIYNEVPDEEILKLKEQLEIFSNDAVTVHIGKDETGIFWSTEDYGVGLSPERVKDVFVKYLKSTKENSDNVIGAFGIGSKSGLSYSDVVFIRTRYNGIEYQYMLRKGENGPRLEILGQSDTTERNGTEIKIYIKDNYSDLESFKKETKNQLAYFDNVYYSGMCNVNNDFKIIKGDNWLLNNSIIPHIGTHLVLGKVGYPIDWQSLDLPSMNTPVALKFEIGELDVILTREDVKYTPKTKEAIKKKIEAFKDEIQERWDNIDKQFTSLKEYYQRMFESPRLSFLEGEYLLNITEIVGDKNGFEFKPFSDVGFVPPRNFGELFFEYNFKGQYNNRFIPFNHSGSGLVDHSIPWNKRNASIYRISQEHDTKKSRYIQEELENNNTLLFVRIDTLQGNSNFLRVPLKNYVKNLGLTKYPRCMWRTIITTFQKEVQKEVIQRTKSYDKVVVDSQWLKDLRKPSTRDTSKVKIKYIGNLFHSYCINSGTDNIIISDVEKNVRSTYFISTEEDERKMSSVFGAYLLFSKASGKIRNSHFRHFVVAPTNVKKFKNVKNLITVESFKKGDSRIFRKMMSLLKIYKQNKKSFEKLKGILNSHQNLLKAVSPTLCKQLQLFSLELSYLENLLTNDRLANDFLSKDCYQIALENNLFDVQYEEELKKLLVNVEGLPDFSIYYNSFDESIENICEFIYLRNKFKKGTKRIPLNIHHVINLNVKYNPEPKKEKKVLITLPV